MSLSSSYPTESQELILAEFIRELESAADRDSVIEKFATRYPDLRQEFEGLACIQANVKDAIPRQVGLTTPRFESGDRLGEFQIIGLIATGGMSEVYEARQDRLGRTVALKVIRLGTVNPNVRSRFVREQQVLAQLHQTHIVPIHAAGEDGDIQYFTMAYIRGATLSRVVETAYDQARTLTGGQTPPLQQLATNPTSQFWGKIRTPRDTTKIQLSSIYFRSVADVMAQAAEAVQYAHDVGVLHRDIKPSNMMVDRDGHCWIIDFGLAGLQKCDTDPTNLTECKTHELLGTPPYMAPEQFDGNPVFASDIWGLGATLYELLTLRQAYTGNTYQEIKQHVQSESPMPLQNLVTGAPRDLAAICAKAMAKDIANRYASAGELAADLRRWLNHEPTQARPAWVFRRAALWVIRNKGWAAAITAVLIAAIALSVFTTIAETHRADAAGARADAALEQLKEQERGAVLRQAADARTGVRQNGWSQRSQELSAKAARLRAATDTRNEMASSFIGLDAKLVKERNGQIQVKSAGISDVVFSPDARWVLAGGLAGEPTWLWNRETDEEKLIAFVGAGPFGYQANGTPVQALLSTKDRQTIVLRDVIGGNTIREFDPPGEPITEAVFSSDTNYLAGESDKAVTVWDTTTGKIVRRIETPDSAGLAFSPDRKLLAVGGPNGQVQLWPLPAGAALPPLDCGRTTVNAVTFGPPVRPVSPNQPISWRLAAGDDGGTVTVWDLSRHRVLSICRGSKYAVHSVSLSSDGMTLASVGRSEGKLWDVSTGRQLLDLIPRINFRNWMSTVAFSPDGSHVVIGSRPAFGSAGGVDVYVLQNGRGVRTLRGLGTQMSRMAVTRDGQRIAALSQDWQVALWDAKKNRLLHLLDAPQGYYADNAGLAFSHDGTQFAFSTGHEAIVWDVATGRVVCRYALPPGMSDAITFHPDGKLYLFRCEVENPKATPQDYDFWAKCPRICRMRELQPGGTMREVRTPITDFTGGVRYATASPDGRYFVVQGWDGVSPGKNIVRVYDSATGNSIWPTRVESDDNWFALDPTGQLLLIGTYNGNAVASVEMPSGKLLGVRTGILTAWFNPGGDLAATTSLPPHNDTRLLTLFQYNTNHQLVIFDTGTRVTQMDGQFTRDGTRFFWGNEDGSVMVCHIQEVRRQLTTHGLGW